MTDAELEAEARTVFRVVHALSQMHSDGVSLVWQVQRMHEGDWRSGYWCASEEAANKRLEMCVKSYVAMSKMTPEERCQRILRGERGGS